MKSKKAFLTIDVDCDLAWPKKGQIASTTKGKPTAEFSKSLEGLLTAVKILEKLDIRATFFLEARTAQELNKMLPLKQLLSKHEIACHGLEHENFTLLGRKQKQIRLKQSKETLEKIFGKKIEGFRAPYLEIDLETLNVLKEVGFAWDSSSKLAGPHLPQIPAPKNLYFWPLIEGKITENEFLERVFTTSNPVLSTHSWHFAAKLEGTPRIPLLEEQTLSKMLEEGYEFALIESFLYPK